MTKSWRELGFKAKETPAALRASADGYVPATMTFPQWLKRQPLSVQQEMLGKRKAELFQSGRISFDRFVDDRSRVRTLAELERLL